jgi:hypothetical protein
MAIDLRTDLLMRKALDGEAMSERELRDFGEAMATSPEASDAFVLMRRIGAETSSLTTEDPSPGFTNAVMAAIAAAPSPIAPIAESPRWRWGAAAAMAAAIAATGLFAPGFDPVAAIQSLSTIDWYAILDSSWAAVETSVDVLATPRIFDTFGSGAVAIAACLLAAAMALGHLLAREKGTD